MRAARVPVFLIDEHQGVRPYEIGTVASIEEAAAANGAAVRRVDLDGQFRCGGSEVYVRWVESLLGLRPGGPQPWPGDDTFQLLLADSPEQMEEELRRKIERGVRGADHRRVLLAVEQAPPRRHPGRRCRHRRRGAGRGTCAPTRPLNGIPPSSLWATEDAGFGQVGCIYTAQGFEYDYGGVIMGADLVWREDHWEPSPPPAATPTSATPTTSTNWSATPTRSCSPAGSSDASSTPSTRRPSTCWPDSASRNCRPLP